MPVMTDLEKHIREEIALLRTKHPQDWSRMYFNNFYAHFPLDGREGMYREMAHELGEWDSPFSDSQNSAKKNSMTRRTFYAEIDHTIAELHSSGKLLPISLHLATRLLTELSKNRMEGFEDLHRYSAEESQRNTQHAIFCELYLPVYITLRESGYSHTDLTS